MIEAYPLCWPVGYQRTLDRKNSRFKQTLGAARTTLKAEVNAIGGKDLIISTNIPVRQDGEFYVAHARYKIEDPGVAIYFNRNGNQVALCCDTYERIWENMYALARTLEALRQISRDGVSDFLNRSFTGFQALPETTSAEREIWMILDLPGKPDSIEAVHQAFKQLRITRHPDRGGTHESFIELSQAYEKAKRFFQS